MKKLMIAAAIVCAAAFAQAATVSWGSGALRTAANANGGWGDVAVNTAGALVTMNVFLVDKTTYDTVSAKDQAGIYEWASGQTATYTAQNKAEEGYDYTGVASKTISVFNVFSTERVPDGVEVVDEQVYASLRSAARPVAAQSALTVRWNGEGLVLANAAGAASLSVSVYHDDGIVPDDRLCEAVSRVFDFRPDAIIRRLDLRRPIYRQTAAYGHFGRPDLDLPWERADQAEALRAAVK